MNGASENANLKVDVEALLSQTNIKPPTFTNVAEERQYLKERLACALRTFAKHGFATSTAGHITIRDPEHKDQFWVNPFGTHFALMRASDLILVDSAGKVIGGGPNRLLNTAAYAIHHAIHIARPDVNAAAHAHSVHGMAFSTLGRTLDITTQDACMFYNDLALYASFGGVVLAGEEGRNIADSLGSKKAIILQNHGLLTVGETVEAAVARFLSLDSLCHVQLLADAAAAGRDQKTIAIGAQEAEFTHKIISSEWYGWFFGNSEMSHTDQVTNGEYKL